jgi:hypothetical protein
LLGDIGGIKEALSIISNFILFGYPSYSFIMKALEKLYLARTKIAGVFDKKLQRQKKINEKKLRFKMLKYPPPADVP